MVDGAPYAPAGHVVVVVVNIVPLCPAPQATDGLAAEPGVQVTIAATQAEPVQVGKPDGHAQETPSACNTWLDGQVLATQDSLPSKS